MSCGQADSAVTTAVRIRQPRLLLREIISTEQAPEVRVGRYQDPLIDLSTLQDSRIRCHLHTKVRDARTARY
jgi:hypothetical protein